MIQELIRTLAGAALLNRPAFEAMGFYSAQIRENSYAVQKTPSDRGDADRRVRRVWRRSIFRCGGPDSQHRGAVEIAMTEAGQTNSYQGKWILNGDLILVEGGEGMMMQLSWRGDSLVTDFGGFTLTFNKT
jgi:hypothetical protein